MANYRTLSRAVLRNGVYTSLVIGLSTAAIPAAFAGQNSSAPFSGFDDGIYAQARWVIPGETGTDLVYAAEGDVERVFGAAVSTYCEGLPVRPGEPAWECYLKGVVRKEFYGASLASVYKKITVSVAVMKAGDQDGGEIRELDFKMLLVRSCSEGAFLEGDDGRSLENRAKETASRPTACHYPTVPISEKQLGLPESETADANTCPIDNQQLVGNPIDPVTGAKLEVVTDFESPGAPELTFRRYYFSAAKSRADGIPEWYAHYPDLARIGSRWRHSFDRRIVVRTRYNFEDQAYQTRFHLVREDGKEIRFVPTPEGLRSDADDGGRLDVSGKEALYTSIDGVVEHYNSNGQMDWRADRNGRTTRLEYKDERLLTVTDSSGRKLRFAYDNHGRVSQAVLPDGGVIGYGYDTATEGGRAADLASVTYPDKRTTRYRYENHLITQVDGADGKPFATFTYYDDGFARRSDHGNGLEWTEVSYGAEGAYSYQEGGLGRTYVDVVASGGAHRVANRNLLFQNQTFNYDENGRVVERKDALGHSTTYAYDNKWNLESERVDAAGTPLALKTTTQWHRDFALPVRVGTPYAWSIFDYDARGNLVKQTEGGVADANDAGSGVWPGSRATGYSYDATGRVTRIDPPRDDLDDAIRMEYFSNDDPGCAIDGDLCTWRKGDLKRVINPLGHAYEALRYDASGRLLSERRANGVIVDTSYDPRGRITAHVTRVNDDGSSSENDATSLAIYNSNGNLESVIDADGATTGIEYDAAHRITAISEADGTRHEFTLDTKGQLTAKADRAPDGLVHRLQKWVYNETGTVSSETINAGGYWRYLYDKSDRLEKVESPNFVATLYAYDALDRMTELRNERADTPVFLDYDGIGGLRTLKDPSGYDTSYLRNGLGDVPWMTSPDTAQSTFEHDVEGRITLESKASGKTAKTSYDALGRLSKVAYSDGTTEAYAYDKADASCSGPERFAVGELASVADASGVTSYCHDRSGRITIKSHVANATPLAVRYDYSLAGRLTGIGYPGGAKLTYVRNSSGNISAVHFDSSALGRVSVTDFRWSADRRPLQWSAGARNLRRAYSLDGWVTSVSDGTNDGLDMVFKHDREGRVKTISSRRKTLEAFYDDLGRIDAGYGASGSIRYEYNESGDRTEDDFDAYRYKAGTHHLIRLGDIARSYDADGNTTSIGNHEYIYDVRGRLVQGKVNGVVEMNYRYNAFGERVERYIAGESIRTVYDEDGHWLGDYDATGRALREIVWLGDWPIMLIEDGKAYDIQPDHLGTPRALVERATNKVVWNWSPVGEVFGNTPPDEDPDGDRKRMVFNMRFPGQIYDAVLDLNYNYQRYYDSKSGRYVQSDLIGLTGGVNTYAYADNSPLMFIDPLGLAWTDAPGDGESLVPLWGSGRQAVNDFSEGRYASGAFNSWMAITDVVPANAIVGALCKGVTKAGIYGYKASRFADKSRQVFTIDKAMVKSTKRHPIMGKFYELKDGMWWTKDRAKHGSGGRPAWKVYERRGDGFHWRRDVDEYGETIQKHKGPDYRFIPNKNMI